MWLIELAEWINGLAPAAPATWTALAVVAGLAAVVAFLWRAPGVAVGAYVVQAWVLVPAYAGTVRGPLVLIPTVVTILTALILLVTALQLRSTERRPRAARPMLRWLAPAVVILAVGLALPWVWPFYDAASSRLLWTLTLFGTAAVFTAADALAAGSGMLLPIHAFALVYLSANQTAAAFLVVNALLLGAALVVAHLSQRAPAAPSAAPGEA